MTKKELALRALNECAFTDKTITIPLLKGFIHDGKVVSSIVIKRLVGTDLKRFSIAFDKEIRDAGNTGNVGDWSFISAAKVLTILSITQALYEDDEIVPLDSAQIVDKIPAVPNFMYIIIMTNCLLRGRTLTSSHYQHQDPSCNQISSFDLDPSRPVPDDVAKEEQWRDYMEDVRQFFVIDDPDPQFYTHFTVELEEPFDITYKIKAKKIVTEPDKEGVEREVQKTVEEEKTVSVKNIRMRYPTFGDYSKAVEERKSNSDLSDLESEVAVFYAIENVNYELDDQLPDNHLNIVKNNVPILDFLRFSVSDLNMIHMISNSAGIEVISNHSVICKSCGKEYLVRPDLANFFAFLSR